MKNEVSSCIRAAKERLVQKKLYLVGFLSIIQMCLI